MSQLDVIKSKVRIDDHKDCNETGVSPRVISKNYARFEFNVFFSCVLSAIVHYLPLFLVKVNTLWVTHKRKGRYQTQSSGSTTAY
jgi:hypothetical protein